MRHSEPLFFASVCVDRTRYTENLSLSDTNIIRPGLYMRTTVDMCECLDICTSTCLYSRIPIKSLIPGDACIVSYMFKHASLHRSGIFTGILYLHIYRFVIFLQQFYIGLHTDFLHLQEFYMFRHTQICNIYSDFIWAYAVFLESGSNSKSGYLKTKYT